MNLFKTVTVFDRKSTKPSSALVLISRYVFPLLSRVHNNINNDTISKIVAL